MSKGFMFLPGEFRKWGWYKNSNMVHMLIHLMYEANYQDGTYMGVTIKRGQLATGRKQLAAETGMTEREVRTCLERLTNDQQIVTQTTNRFSIITVCNYDSWHGLQKPNDQPPTNKTPTDDQQSGTPNDHNNKDNKDIKDNIKEEGTKVPEKKEPEGELEKQFEAFRLKYKSYGGKVRGFQVEFDELKKKHKDWKEVIPMLSYAIDKEATERSAALRRGDFFAQIKNLKTYLNQRSWECYTDGFESYDPNEYHPQDMEYDSEFNAYRFYGLQPEGYVYDGYEDDNRPDGARVVSQCFVWEWRKPVKKWEQLW